MLKVEQLLNLHKSPIQKHKLKAKSKFEDSLKPLSKTLKAKRKRKGKKNRRMKKSPENKNRKKA